MAEALLSTEYDVMRILERLYPDDREEKLIRTRGEILNAIQVGDGKIRSFLRGTYGSTLTCTPYANNPWADRANDTAESKSEARLIEATASASAITEGWEIEFSDNSGTFAVIATFSGTQGSGTKATAFASTNTYLSIAAAKWVGLPRKGERFFVCTYNVEPMLVLLSSKQAAAIMLRSVYAAEIGGNSEYADSLEKEVSDMLEKLADSSDPASLSRAERSVLTEGQRLSYNIDTKGEDITTYPESTDVDEWEAWGR